jgi:hypothetical protein
LKRHSTLKQGTTPLKRTRMRQVSEKRATKPKKAKRVEPAVPPPVKARLRKRSGGVCEAQLQGCLWYATDAAHRITRKIGGRHGEAKELHDRLSDLLDLCRMCHDWSGARPKEAGQGELGIVLKEHHDPLAEPVVYRGRLSFLTDDGSVIPFEEREVAA